MKNLNCQSVEAAFALDQTIPPEEAVSVPGYFAIEADRVIISLEEPLVLDATALLVRLRRVSTNDDTSDNLRTTAEKLTSRLAAETDPYTLSDAAVFLGAVGEIPVPERSYDGMSEDEKDARRTQLNRTLTFTRRRGDQEGTALVTHYLGLLG